MRARLLAGFLLFVLAVTIALELPLGLIQQTRETSSARQFVRRASSALAVLVGDALDHAEPSRAEEVATRYVRGLQIGVVVSSGGRVLFHLGGASAAEVRAPDISRAMHIVGSTTRSGETTAAGRDVLYAVDLADRADASTHLERAVVVVTEPVSVVDDNINDEWLKLAGLGAGVLVAAALLGLLISASMIRPLRRIEAAVTAIGEGALDTRAPTESGPSELRELASEVNATAARLSRLLDAQRAFAANASHQLRTPLTAIRLRLEQARQTANLESARQIEAALEEVRRLSRMVNALLELGRDQARQPERVPIDVAGVISERLDAWRPLAEEQGLDLVGGVDSDGRGPLVALACPATLDQVLDNLLANAFEATPAGGRVSVAATGQGSFVEIHVTDDGHGLAVGEHELAFDRFWRGGDARPGGSGLGLAIVDHLVRLSGGSAELRARADGGTDAVVRVPVA